MKANFSMALRLCLVGICCSASAQPQSSEQARLSEHVKTLNELTERRRVNSFFINQTPLNQGLQSHYVNTSTGKLSFLRRDLVLPGRLPIVIARVYDSHLNEGEDFGPGWRLSLAESLVPQPDGSYEHYNSHGATISIASNSAQLHAFGDSQLRYFDENLIKTFVKSDGKYLLSAIESPQGEKITLFYQNGLIQRVAQKEHEVVLIRDNQGRITRMTDNFGRSVQYHYSKKQLDQVNDMGGSRWQYQYTPQQQLKKVIDPQNNIAATFKYDAQRRVRFAEIRAEVRRYAYYADHTVVTQDKDRNTAFYFNKAGITTSVTNARGVTSTVKLNKFNQPTQLLYDGKIATTIAYLPDGRTQAIIVAGKRRAFRYDDHQRLTSLVEDGQSVMHFERDAKGRPLSIVGDGATRQYRYYPNGDVKTFTTDGIHRQFEYDDNGLLTRMTENGQTVHFNYNALGRLKKITFPTGDSHEYDYDELGLRLETRRSDGSKLHYNYDSTGNFRGSVSTAADGRASVKEILLDADNKVEQQLIDGRLTMDVHYVGGNPQSLAHGKNKIEYEYDALDRLETVRDGLKAPIEYQYAEGEDDIRLQQDDRTSGLYTPSPSHGLSATFYTRTTTSPWRHIIWNEALGRLMLASNDGVIAPDEIFLSASHRRRLYDAVATTRQQRRNFDKPSSSQWTPPEYQTINCDPVYCVIYGVILDPIGSPYVGQSTTLSAFALGDNDCIPEYQFVVDGQTQYYGLSPTYQYAFQTAGSHSVQVNAACTCTYKFVKWDLATVTVLPVIENVAITATPGQIWTIDQQRNMPSIQFKATYTPLSVPLEDITFHWYLTLDFNAHSRSYSHRIPASGTVDVTGSIQWTPQWGNVLAGANNMTVNVSASYGGHTTPANPVSGYQIQGENPSQAQIFTVATSDEAKAVCWQESSHRQFEGAAYNGIGLPLYGSPDGWGLMQRDPLQSEAQLWDWHQALSDGVDYLNLVHGNAQAYLNYWYTINQNDPFPANDWAWDPHSQFPERVWDDAFSRYNTGTTIYSSNGNEGNRNCSGQYSNAAGCTYADLVRGHVNNQPWLNATPRVTNLEIAK